MVFDPADKWLPYTSRDAVPDAERFALPNVVLPEVKVTDPEGVADPLTAFTVAVSVTVDEIDRVCGFAVNEVAVALPGCTFHEVARLYASTEPSPVTRS